MTPLLLKECYYRLVEGRLVGRRVVVALTSLEACRGDFPNKARHLLVGRVGFSIEDQDRHINGAEQLGGPHGGDGTANHRRKDLRISAANASRD